MIWRGSGEGGGGMCEDDEGKATYYMAWEESGHADGVRRFNCNGTRGRADVFACLTYWVSAVSCASIWINGGGEVADVDSLLVRLQIHT